jgi:hypothetical protein
MVRGLVEQQHVGLADKGGRQRDPPHLAPGEPLRAPGGVHPELLQHDLGPVARTLTALAQGQAREHDFRERHVVRQDRLLRQVGHARPRLHEAPAGIELEEAAQRLQQSGLAGTIAADEADPVAAHDPALQPLEQGLRTDAERSTVESQQRGRHGYENRSGSRSSRAGKSRPAALALYTGRHGASRGGRRD